MLLSILSRYSSVTSFKASLCLYTTLTVYPHRFAAISSIMSSVWVREGAVEYGSLCTAQGGHGDLII